MWPTDGRSPGMGLGPPEHSRDRVPVSPERPERRESSSASPAASACPGPDLRAPSRGLSGVFRRLRLPMMRRAGGGRASTATPGSAGALARSRRCVSAGLLLTFVALLALLPEAQAQTTIKLVGNGADSGSTSHLGTDSSGNYRELAQQFTITISNLQLWVHAGLIRLPYGFLRYPRTLTLRILSQAIYARHIQTRPGH